MRSGQDLGLARLRKISVLAVTRAAAESENDIIAFALAGYHGVNPFSEQAQREQFSPRLSPLARRSAAKIARAVGIPQVVSRVCDLRGMHLRTNRGASVLMDGHTNGKLTVAAFKGWTYKRYTPTSIDWQRYPSRL